MRRPSLVLACLALSATALAAQPSGRRTSLVVSGGVAGQNDGDGDLGAPGLSAAAGVEWRANRALGLRLEVAGFRYPDQALAAAVGARGSAERIGTLAGLAVWAPPRGAPVYALAGGALTSALVTGQTNRESTVAVLIGVGAPAWARVAVEAHYLHAARRLGQTRSAVAARVLLRF